MSVDEVVRSSWSARSAALPAGLRKVLAPLFGQDGSAQTGRAAIFAFAIRVASAAIAYLSQILLARWMGSFEYGVFVFVWVWVLILGGLTTLGLSAASMRYVAEYRETGEHALLRGLLRRSRAIAFAASTLLALSGIAALYAFGDLIAQYYVLPAFLILFCLPMYTLEDVQDGIARGRGWMDVALVPPFILRPLMLLAAMLAVYLGGFEMSAVSAAGAAVFACWVSAIVQGFQLRKRFDGDIGKGPSDFQTKLWMATALPLLLFHGFELLLQNTDILVLSVYVSPSDVAVYFAALKTINLVAFVHFAVGAASAHRFAAHNAAGEKSKLQHAVRDAARWTFWPSVLGAVALLLLGKPLLWLFGSEFTAGYGAMFLLAVGLVLRAATGPVEVVLNMLGQQKVCAAILFATAGLNLALNFALIPFYGLMGAAAATAISMALGALSMSLAAYRRLRLRSFI
ncbi:MAG: lipopolysaccharide biosynthesis protein [Hyphomicrobiaceae bacterium]|nr:lipopolysaccharide biosynthesis protein [Hyphomicrobiaceae bacterium]